ncbi:MAG: hypothetical protein QOF35_1482, partial [Actinomycetota bacterium]|nr:hypothetical protein [Actinomycetota bacterium]
MSIRSSRQQTPSRRAKRREVSTDSVTANTGGTKAGSTWLTHLGVQSGYLAGAL